MIKRSGGTKRFLRYLCGYGPSGYDDLKSRDVDSSGLWIPKGTGFHG